MGDGEKKKKALFRAKLNEKLEKNRIDSPLIRYNEVGKPVCRVCDVVLKSDCDWKAHQASRKHHEAINNLKASASRRIDKSETIKPHRDDLFDHGDNKKQKVGTSLPARMPEKSKGELPDGFFDDKEADLRAHGIQPVKPDVKDQYKEFEKVIQEDLAQVDNRFEEEEINAAEQIEEEEIIEQRTYRSRVEELKKKKMELLAARSSKAGKVSEVSESKAEQDDISSEDEDEDEDDESFAVDWRAQHL